MKDQDPLLLVQTVAYFEDGYLAARNSPPLTRETYRRDLTELVAFLTERCGLTHVAQVQRRHLERFLSELDARGLSGNYRRRKVAAIRSLFRFWRIERSSPRVLRASSSHPHESTGSHASSLSRSTAACWMQSGTRHETPPSSSFSSRPAYDSPSSRLKVRDIELPAKISKEPGNVGRVLILGGKGRKDRAVTLNWKACKAVRSYLAVRPQDTGDPRLFLTKFKRGIGPRSIERLVAKYLQDAGIHGASVHTLRHTFGTQQAKRGTKLRVIQEALGHENLETTSIYVSLAREDMDRELQENAL